jgi:hypothetical protein
MKLQNGVANQKVTAAFVAGTVSALTLGTIAWAFPELAQPPVGFESALTGILIVLAAWWKKEHE